MAAVLSTVSDVIKTGAQLTQLSAVGDFYSSLNFNLLIIAHCLIVSRWTKGNQGSGLLNYICGFLMAFGGGIATHYFLVSPKAMNPATVTNLFSAAWTLAWWLTNYCPGNPAGRLLDIKIVSAVCAAALQVLRAGLISDRIDITANRYPGVIAASMVAGILSGCAGKILNDLLLGALGKGGRGPSELESPTYPLRSSAVASALYYLTVVYLGALTAAEGKALIITIFVLHQLASDLFGLEYDWTEPAVNALNFGLRVGGIGSGIGKKRLSASPSRARASRSTRTKTPVSPRGGAASGDDSEPAAKPARTPRRRTARST